MPDSLETSSSQKEIDSVARKIFEAHVSRKKPGTRLPAATTLASNLGVSRYTIRVALDRLASRNQVELRRGAGAFVAVRLVDRYEKYIGKQIAVSLGKSWLALADQFNQSVLAGMYNGLYNTGLDLLLTSQNWTQRDREPPAQHFGARSVAGVILIGRQQRPLLNALKKLKRKPKLSLDWDATDEGIPSFCFDNIAAAALLARRLHKLGHRRILAILESPKRARLQRDPAWDLSLIHI